MLDGSERRNCDSLLVKEPFGGTAELGPGAPRLPCWAPFRQHVRLGDLFFGPAKHSTPLTIVPYVLLYSPILLSRAVLLLRANYRLLPLCSSVASPEMASFT